MIKLTINHSHQHLSHEDIPCHPRRQSKVDLVSIEEKIAQIRQEKERLKELKRQEKLMINVKTKPDEIDHFLKAYQDSQIGLPEHILSIIQQKTKFIEDKVYIGSKENVNEEFMTRMVDELGEGLMKEELTSIMTNIHSSIGQDIVDGLFDVHKVRQISNETFRTQPVIKLASQTNSMRSSQKSQQPPNEQSQTGTFNEQNIEQNSPPTKSIDPPKVLLQRKSSLTELTPIKEGPSNEYSPKKIVLQQKIEETAEQAAERARLAEQFVRKIQQEQQEARKKRREKEQAEREAKIKQEKQQKEFQQVIKKQKHQLIEQRYKKARQLKEAELQHQQKIKDEFDTFLSEYKKRVPLYKDKEKKFNASMENYEANRVKEAIKQIKEQHKPMDITSIKEHEKRYQEVKKEHEQDKMAQLKLQEQERRAMSVRKQYRGRFHEILKEEAQIIPENPKVHRDQLINRKRAFSQKVRKQYRDKNALLTDRVDTKTISESNNRQDHLQIDSERASSPTLSQLSPISKMVNKTPKPSTSITKPLTETEMKDRGNDYLKQLHSRIDALRREGKLKNQTHRDIDELSTPLKKDYLTLMRAAKERSRATGSGLNSIYEGQSQTIDYDELARKSPQYAIRQGEKHEAQARRREKVLRHSVDFSLAWFMKQTQNLDQDYINSARAKAALFNSISNKEQHFAPQTISENRYLQGQTEERDNQSIS